MAVVSDASPLILLAKTGRLSLLYDVFGEVLIPKAVYDEVVARGAHRPGASDIEQARWIRVHPVSNPTLLHGVLADLDAGEAEAIALVIELGSTVPLLVDDRAARRIARQHGIETVGTAGALIRAKDLGVIPDVRPALDELRTAGLYLSKDAYAQVLAMAGEPWAKAEEG